MIYFYINLKNKIYNYKNQKTMWIKFRLIKKTKNKRIYIFCIKKLF